MNDTLTDEQRKLFEIQQKRAQFDTTKQEYLNAPVNKLLEKFVTLEETKNGLIYLIQELNQLISPNDVEEEFEAAKREKTGSLQAARDAATNYKDVLRL